MLLLTDFLARLPRAAQIGWAVAILAGLTGLGYLAGPAIEIPLLFVLLVAVVARFAGLPSGVLVSALATACWLGLTRVQDPATPIEALLWTGLLRLGCLVVLAAFTAALGQALDYARTDYLTGIDNNRAFYDAAQAESHRSRRYGSPFTLVYLDVDDLRKVNERFGHAVGDALLRSVAAVMRNSLRGTDHVARLGADHFAVLLPETDREAAAGVLRKLEGVLLGIAGKGDWTSSFSIGAVTFTQPPETVETALNRAEDLMYAARRSTPSGRVRWQAETVPAPGSAALRPVI